MLHLGPALVLCALAGALAPAHADDEPPDPTNLVLAGAAMAVPTYFLGVFIHEGSHALTAKAFGAEVIEFKVLPGRTAAGDFYFGYTRIRGDLGVAQRTVFLLAPKITDSLMLGGYALALELDGLPANRYGRLAFAVLATGFWVDLSKDIFGLQPRNDINKLLELHGADTFWERLPWRMLHLGAAVAGGYLIFRGYQDVFSDDGGEPAPAALMPLWHGRF
jgi:hypothetical protein